MSLTMEKINEKVRYVLIDKWTAVKGTGRAAAPSTKFLDSTTETPITSLEELNRQQRDGDKILVLFAKEDFPEVFKRMPLKEAGDWAAATCLRETGRLRLNDMEAYLNNLNMDYGYL